MKSSLYRHNKICIRGLYAFTGRKWPSR